MNKMDTKIQTTEVVSGSSGEAKEAVLEHLNVTVSSPEKTAQMLHDIFGWEIRWRGDAIDGGMSIHVGGKNSYLAIYGPKIPAATARDNNYKTIGGLNHVGIVVDDLDAVEAKVLDAGLTPRLHGNYEPGRRFYFDDPDGIEFEVVSYG